MKEYSKFHVKALVRAVYSANGVAITKFEWMTTEAQVLKILVPMDNVLQQVAESTMMLHASKVYMEKLRDSLELQQKFANHRWSIELRDLVVKRPPVIFPKGESHVSARPA